MPNGLCKKCGEVRGCKRHHCTERYRVKRPRSRPREAEKPDSVQNVSPTSTDDKTAVRVGGTDSNPSLMEVNKHPPGHRYDSDCDCKFVRVGGTDSQQSQMEKTEEQEEKKGKDQKKELEQPSRLVPISVEIIHYDVGGAEKKADRKVNGSKRTGRRRKHRHSSSRRRRHMKHHHQAEKTDGLQNVSPTPTDDVTLVRVGGTDSSPTFMKVKKHPPGHRCDCDGDCKFVRVGGTDSQPSLKEKSEEHEEKKGKDQKKEQEQQVPVSVQIIRFVPGGGKSAHRKEEQKEKSESESSSDDTED